MSWRRGAKSAGSGGFGCLNDLLMWMCVAPGLGVLVALAWISGDPASMLGAVVFAVLVFGLYLLASWD
jgi:hypothetical protein